MSEHVYFVGNKSHVKIGKSTNIASRISTIQTASPLELKVLTKVRCISISETEKMLHRFFDALRYKGEWFYNLGHLEELITRLQTYDDPSEFYLGYELGVITQRIAERKQIIYQHRLRAVYQALVKMKFDVNGDEFHELQNEFIAQLVETHPSIYKRYVSQENDMVLQLIDAPYQPYPLYEYSLTTVEEIKQGAS